MNATNPHHSSKAIEAILFHRSEAVKEKELQDILGIDREALEEGVAVLADTLKDRGIVLIRKDGKMLLGTAPDVAPIVERIIKDELQKELGKAGVDTLTVVLYAGPITRPDIDYIRGVNSSYILKHLLVRGLVERIADTRHNKFFYRPTFELLAYLGLTDITDLPEYERIRAELVRYADDSSDMSEDDSIDERDTGKGGKTDHQPSQGT